MKSAHLNRLIGIMSRTGEKAFVVDPASDDVLVLMSLDEYESFVDGKNNVLPQFPFDDDALSEEISFDTDAGDALDDVGTDFEAMEARAFAKAETASDDDLEFDAMAEGTEHDPARTSVRVQDSPLEFSSDWAAHNSRTTSEESLSDVPHDEEEEQFYLEPVE